MLGCAGARGQSVRSLGPILGLLFNTATGTLLLFSSLDASPSFVMIRNFCSSCLLLFFYNKKVHEELTSTPSSPLRAPACPVRPAGWTMVLSVLQLWCVLAREGACPSQSVAAEWTVPRQRSLLRQTTFVCRRLASILLLLCAPFVVHKARCQQARQRSKGLATSQ